MVSPELQQMPPSAKLVFKVLEWNGELTQPQIVEESMLPQRTIRYVLTKLESEDLVEKRLLFRRRGHRRWCSARRSDASRPGVTTDRVRRAPHHRTPVGRRTRRRPV